MGYYKTGYRRINGKRRKVRKLIEGGKIRSVRIFGLNHYTDKTARKHGLKRKHGWVNNTNADARIDYHRRRRR